MNFKALFIALFIFPVVVTAQETIVLKGGTIIDVENFGKSTNDVKNSIIIIEEGKIRAVGNSKNLKIPPGARVIDIKGKYVVPGLIDAFAGLKNQSYANAYLYSGITTIVALQDIRRGKVFWDANPSPAKMKLTPYWGADSKNFASGDLPRASFINLNCWSDDKISRDIDSLARTGVKVLLIHYGVVPKQLPAIIAACKKNNIATIGELGLCAYEDGVKAGIQSFVHTSRYSADILPDSIRKAYSNAPFGPPVRYYFEYVVQHPDLLKDEKLTALTELYKTHQIGLIPTASMLVYPEMAFAKNPWKEPVASLISEQDIVHEPIDKETGKRKTPASPMRVKAAPMLLAIDEKFAKNGAHYLAGSGTDAFGTLPGVSFHTELEMLTRFGLNNREVLASATHNFSLLWNWTHLGKIEQGREADILVLSKNPIESLDHLKQIDLLLLDGKLIDRNRLLEK